MTALRHMATAFAVMLAATITASAAPDLVVKGDPRAWAEIQDAFIKLFKLKSYRMKVSTAEGAITISFVPPDKTHTVVSQGGNSIESIRVGNESRVRQGGGPWQCLPAGARMPQLGGEAKTDPSKIAGEVNASKGPVVAVDGMQTQSYAYSHTAGGTTAQYRMFVGVTNGLPKRLQGLDGKGGVTSTIDYYDYDAPITITLPACA